ncbi:MAG: FGGY family carbohydrate kinase, partial [Acidobacteriaceae bacterium]
MLFLGIDVGTGGSRAVLIDETGTVVASHATEHVPFQSKFPGWAEQDPEDWWRASQESIRTVLSVAACKPEDIAAVGLTGQMHGAVLLDSDGQVLRPSLIWCDTRSGPQCDWLHATLGREHVIELTCNPALPNFTLTKILWVREHEPEIFARIAHILCPKDYVRFRLSGVYAMDVQEASGTLLLDVTHRRWSIPMAEASSVPLKWLPQLFESAEVCATVSKSAAATTGLVAGTPIVAGAGDQGAGAVGMGIL